MAQQTEVVPPVAEEVEKTKSEETPEAVEDESKSENGDSKSENGDSTAEKENGKEESEEKTEEEAAPETDKCSIKRKSVGSGDVPDGTPAEGVTPEKKAKLEETAEPESNGKSEVAA